MPIPERIGRYRIQHKLGEGGMGIVYAAHDEELDRAVALKMLGASQGDESAKKRFRREARAAAKLVHPNVCQLYDIGEHDGEPFLAMELLDGESLHERIARGALPFPDALGIACDILSALTALHHRGIVHRDLKPSNVFLTSHGVKLLDFGLARTVISDAETEDATESQLTKAGAVMGTPHYMSPEQFRGERVDERSDLFAVGVMLFEMLAGARPFRGSTPVEIYHATLYEQPQALGGSPAVALVDRAVRKALGKKREDRFQSAAEMGEALKRALEAPDSGQAPRARAITRLIVLPFRMLRPDADIDFLALSIPDAIAISLAGLESITVRSSAAAARYAGENVDLEKISKEADVDVVLTGTLLRGGETIRVSTQLLSTPDGTLLWSHTPQVTMRDVFQLQDDIVQRIVEALSLELTARESRMLKRDVPASPSAFELYLRGSQIVIQGLRGGEDLSVARDLFLRCVEEDPSYAPAWARLGWCHWLIGKGAEGDAESLAKAESCFEKALALNSELPLAQNLYARLQTDSGRAKGALVALLARAKSGSAEPALYAALAHTCRYCGLLEASVAAHERALRLDPQIPTSGNQTLFQLGDWERAKHELERIARVTKATVYTDALLLFEEGNATEALGRLVEREHRNLPDVTRALVTSLRALIEDKRDESLDATRRFLSHYPDPEGLFYVSRHLAYWNEKDEALGHLERVLERGFEIYRMLTRTDPWLDSIRGHAGFDPLLAKARASYLEAKRLFTEAGGDRLLGVDVPA